MSSDRTLRYKVVETGIVADDVLEDLINERTGKGRRFEDIRFAMKDSSRRPVMAFLFFTSLGDASTDEGFPNE